MKSLSRSLLMLVLMLISALPSPGQWVQATGPHGGDVTCFAGLGGDIFAGTSFYGLYKSSDGGNSWHKVITDSTPLTGMNALLVKGSYLFAAGGGVIGSSDSGASWSLSGSGLPHAMVWSLISVDSELVAGSDFFGVSVSTDNGGSWTAADSGFPSGYTSVFSLIQMDTMIFAGTDRGVYLSTDRGVSWSTAGLADSVVFNFAVYDTSIFAVTSNRGFFKSTDKGASWSRADTGLPDTVVYSCVTVSGTQLYLGTSNGAYLSTDAGGTWGPAGLESVFVRNISVFGTRILAGTYGNGVYSSTDGGLTWLSVGLPCKNLSTLVAVGRRLFAESTHEGVNTTAPISYFDEGFISSSDGGSNWESSDFAYGKINAAAVSGSNLFAAGDSGVFLTTNNGSSWTAAGMSDKAVTALAATGTCVIAGTSQGVYLSIDNGAVWDSTNLRAFDPGVVALLAVSDTNMFAATNSGIFHSTDGGNNWSIANTGLTYVTVTCLGAMGNTIFAGSYANGVFLSTNNGQKWLTAGSGITNPFIRCMAVTGSRVFVGADNFRGTAGNVFFTTDGGNKWGVASEGLPKGVIQSLLAVGDTLFAATDFSGLWLRPLSEMVTGIDSRAGRVRSGFALDQNYPNPFNPTTAIRYQLPALSHVTLKVYDVLGRGVATLVNEVQKAGSYEVRFDGSRLPSGVYFYRLQAGTYSDTKKLLILK